MQKILSHIFSFNGRLSRGQYILHNVIILLLFFHLLCLIKIFNSDFHSSSAILITVSLILLISDTSAIIRRFHDLGSTGIQIFFFVVPILNLYYGILLNFREGESENEYGLDSIVSMQKGESPSLKKYALIAVTLVLIIVFYYTFFNEQLN